MRTPAPKPKTLTRVPVPDRFRSFMSEVRELIERGDEAALVPSDDLLQSDDAHGGLTDDGDYFFVFFPGADVRRKWEIKLRRDDISAIATGQMAVLELWRCREESCGCMFFSRTELCFYCDYVDDNPDRIPERRCNTRREWALAYFALQPGAQPFQMIGAYNSQPHLGEELGLFSLDEATEILADFQRGRWRAAADAERIVRRLGPDTMKDRTFWWGASLAFLPALVGSAAVSHSGMAAINAVWRLMFDHDSPGPFMVVGGIGYGLTVGVLIPLIAFGSAARVIWPVASPRTAPSPSSTRRVAEWIGLQILTLPISLGLTFAAYALPWMFLGAR